MIRKQLYFEEELDRDLKALARRTGQSEAAHVRQALRTYLAQQLSVVSDADDDPLLELIGLAGDGAAPADLARNHDHYLYGAPKPADPDAG